MSGSISFNPYVTSAPQNSFLLQTQGYVQGLALDDPSARMWLSGGTLAAAETLVMWGGVPIQEYVNNHGSFSEQLGSAVARSTSQATITGWSVFNQAASMVITPGNSVPVAAIRNYVSFFRNGSQMRIPVKCDPALVAALTGTSPVNPTNLYWDTTNYWIGAGAPGGGQFALAATTRLLSVSTNSKVVNYASGAATWVSGNAALILI